MDSAKLILTGSVSPPVPLNNLASMGKATEQQKKQAAKQFESILITRLLEQMRNTIGDSGLLEEAGSKRIEDMFWMYLARDIADKGGFGLWKNIYQELTGSAVNKGTETAAEITTK